MPNTSTLTPLTPGTSYVLDTVHVDGWLNPSAVGSSATFTTDASSVTASVITQSMLYSGTGSWSAVPFGTAAANRKIYAFVWVVSSLPATGCEIGGVEAVPTAELQVDGRANEYLQIWEADVPTGTSGNVVLSGPTDRHALAVVATYGRTATTVTAQESSNVVDLSANVTTGGEVFAMVMQANDNTGITWTGATEDSKQTDLFTGHEGSFAAAQNVAAASPRTVTASTAASAAGIALVLA